MKMKKIFALVLALAMVAGLATACKEDKDETTAATTEAATTTTGDATDATDATDDTTAEPASSTPANVAPVANVSDEGSDAISLYGWNEEFTGLLNKWMPDLEYTYEMTESTQYQAKLDSALSAGDGAPDLFLLEADYAAKYVDSDNTININDVGIDYADLANQYAYTYEFTMDDIGAIKAVSWQACPCAVFYNVTVAEAALGVSEPDDVAPYFATWDKFIETAATVSEATDGACKIISGTDDIWRAFLNTRSQGWIVDGEVYVDEVFDQYFDLAKTLYDDNLTFQTAQWSPEWTANASNETVLSYWGPMWLVRFSLSLNDPADAPANPTSGDWRAIPAPSSSYWGGTWLAATKYCDMKATAKDIMTKFTIDSDFMMGMAQDGEFVNNVEDMTTIANDTSFALEYLGGQNPFGILLDEAVKIDLSCVGPNDQDINTAFNNAVNSYLAGDVATPDDAITAFTAAVEDLGVI